ncbi:MAG: aminoacyl-histidine dipeptidase [Clostridia bacterium]|nr:aminoacyl-histidine dipeptidase [Clostridia bacterium]
MNTTENKYVISGYEPKRLFRFFEDICRIPRGSGNEKGISDYLVAFANERGLEVHQDEELNVLIRKPATAGYENEPSILLQGHVDMVCEKNNDTVHDFLTDPIIPYVDGKFLKARGTTLGGDNGIAVATMMALLDGELDAHPELECLFTTSEETGLNGAYAFDYSLIKSTRMINMDSEADDCVIVGCAGGLRSDVSVEYTPIALPDGITPVKVSVSGLMGGHSGENINDGRANANKLVAMLIKDISSSTDTYISAIVGGSKDNAIPRECEAYIAVKDADAAREAFELCASSIKDALGEDDAAFNASFDVTDAANEYATLDATKALIDFFYRIPVGVLKMSLAMENFVEFSRNLGVIRSEGNKISFVFSTRSAIERQLDSSIRVTNSFTDRLNMTEGVSATANHYSRYPGWEYAEVSALREQFVRIHEELYGQTPIVKSIHAGLECGIIASRCPGMDIIAIGPDMKDIHSPAEALDLISCEKFYRILSKMLTEKQNG